MDVREVTWLNRFSFGLVLLLLAAVGFASLSVLTAGAGADDKPLAVRDGGPGHDGADDDHDDDDDDDATPTGTTRGTGPSHTATNDTATGTRTRGGTATNTGGTG